MFKTIKVSQQLAETAAREAETMSRSLAKQVEHWANLGRHLESSGLFNHEQLFAFLQGELEFDDLTVFEQAIAKEQMLEELEDFEPSQRFLSELETGLEPSA